MAIHLAAHDCVAQALSRLPAHLQRQRWQELTAAIAAEIQEVDDAVVAIALQLHLDQAEGAMLDLIGREVREDRSGRSDDAYRKGIYIRVVALRSRSLAEDVLRVVRMVLDSAAKTVTLATTGPATATLVIAGPEGMTNNEAMRLTEYARGTIAGGVRLRVETCDVADAEAFRFGVLGELPRAVRPPATFAVAWKPDVTVVELASGSFTTDLDEASLRVATTRSLYVDGDPLNLAASDANPGTDPALPLRSIWAALNKWGVNQNIYVKAGWYPVGRSWSGGVPFGGHVNVVGVSDFGTLAPGQVVSSVSEEVTALTWTSLGGGVWSAPLASAPYAVVDLASGSPSWFAVQASAVAVNAPGKYHHGAGTVTVATSTGAAPASTLRILRDSVHNGWLNTALDVTVENFHFEGGGNLRCFFAQHCATLSFIDCAVTLSEGEGFGLQTSSAGVTHRVNHIRSTAKWNANDGIQYTATGAGTSIRALELDCTATENGRTGGSNQGSTGHRDVVANPHVALVRVGGSYSGNEAQEISDVGCLVWMLGCSLDGTDDVGSGYELADGGEAWLHGVTIRGVVNDLATNDAAGVIHVHDTAYATTTGPGTVAAYTPTTYLLENVGGKGFVGGPLASAGGAFARVQE